jgi:predicted transcriptional regulator
MDGWSFKISSNDILDKANTRTIIEAASNPKSIREISTECGISLSTVYRRVYELCDHKLLEVHSSAIRDGRRRLLFVTKGSNPKA